MLNNFTKLTEDVHSQIKFADEANACFDDVLKKLKEIVKNKRIKNSDGVYYSNVYGGGNGLSDKGDAIILTNRKHDTVNMYNDKYLNLSGLNNNDLPYTDILITNCRLTKAGVFMMRQDYIEQNQIVLYCLQNNPQSEVEAITSLTAILSSPAKLKDMRSTFVHEYMHLCEHNMRYIKNKDFEFEDQDLPWSERQHEIDAVLLQYVAKLKDNILLEIQKLNRAKSDEIIEKRINYILCQYPRRPDITTLKSRLNTDSNLRRMLSIPKIKNKIYGRMYKIYTHLIDIVYKALEDSNKLERYNKLIADKKNVT